MSVRDIHKNDIWQKGHNTLCHIDIREHKVCIKNLRCMDHASGVELYNDVSFELTSLEQVNLLSVPFGYKKRISHLMLEYVLAGGKKYILSIEARRKPGEKFSPVKGFLKHYGLIYIWGEYNDLVGLRKDIRRDQVYSYNLNFDNEQMRESFIFFANKTNALAHKPEYYHTIFSNCSTNIWNYFRNVSPTLPRYNYYLIFNAKIQVYLKKLGFIR